MASPRRACLDRRRRCSRVAAHARGADARRALLRAAGAQPRAHGAPHPPSVHHLAPCTTSRAKACLSRKRTAGPEKDGRVFQSALARIVVALVCTYTCPTKPGPVRPNGRAAPAAGLVDVAGRLGLSPYRPHVAARHDGPDRPQARVGVPLQAGRWPAPTTTPPSPAPLAKPAAPPPSVATVAPARARADLGHPSRQRSMMRSRTTAALHLLDDRDHHVRRVFVGGGARVAVASRAARARAA